MEKDEIIDILIHLLLHAPPLQYLQQGFYYRAGPEFLKATSPAFLIFENNYLFVFESTQVVC